MVILLINNIRRRRSHIGGSIGNISKLKKENIAGILSTRHWRQPKHDDKRWWCGCLLMGMYPMIQVRDASIAMMDPVTTTCPAGTEKLLVIIKNGNIITR